MAESRGERTKRADKLTEFLFEEPEMPRIAGYGNLQLFRKGGMEPVYTATENSSGKLVAIKIAKDEGFVRTSQIQRFKRACDALLRIKHPNVVHVLGSGILSDDSGRARPYLVMEFIQGRELSSLIRPGGLPVNEVSRIMLQLCDALRHIHSRRVVHRDIKPANLLIAEDGTLKVVDFGIALDLSLNDRLTTNDVGPHTPGYAAPEVATGRFVDARSDIFSCGVVLSELLTGAKPSGFTKDRFPVAMHDWIAIVDRATAWNWIERYPNIRRLRQAIKRANGSTLFDRVYDPIMTIGLLVMSCLAPAILTCYMVHGAHLARHDALLYALPLVISASLWIAIRIKQPSFFQSENFYSVRNAAFIGISVGSFPDLIADLPVFMTILVTLSICFHKRVTNAGRCAWVLFELLGEILGTAIAGLFFIFLPLFVLLIVLSTAFPDEGFGDPGRDDVAFWIAASSAFLSVTIAMIYRREAITESAKGFWWALIGRSRFRRDQSSSPYSTDG